MKIHINKNQEVEKLSVKDFCKVSFFKSNIPI